VHFRTALNIEFRRRCERNPRYSLCAFARDLGSDHATLSQLVCCFLLAITACSSQARESKTEAGPPLTWIFLNTGASRAQAKSMTQEALEKMQADHVGNFGVQFNLGKLITAGPLGDDGFIRGIVILAVQTPEQIAECFKPDPFVQNDLLAVEAHPWLVDVMKFGTPKVPFQIGEHTLCVVKKDRNWKASPAALTTESLLKLFPSLETKANEGEVAVSGPFTDGGEQLGVLLFYSSNQVQLQAQLEKEPEVAEGRVRLEFHPQYLGRGVLRNPLEDLSPPKPARQTPLFDGKSFAGWEGDTNQAWRIMDGALVGGTLKETVPHNDFLCTTKEFKNFDLRLKVKLNGTGFVNGGVQFHSQRLKDPPYEMAGFQADMGEGYWGSLYDESRRNKNLAHTHAAVIKRLVKAGDWNDYIIRCENSHIRLWLNGVLTVDYTEDDKKIPLSGLIGLQIHGGGKAEAFYKDIMIQELP
jgi:uncharacterized protein YciI